MNWYRLVTKGHGSTQKARTYMRSRVHRIVREDSKTTLVEIGAGEVKWLAKCAKDYFFSYLATEAPTDTVATACGAEMLSAGTARRHASRCRACKRLRSNGPHVAEQPAEAAEPPVEEAPAAAEPDESLETVKEILKRKLEQTLDVGVHYDKLIQGVEAMAEEANRVATLEADLARHRQAVMQRAREFLTDLRRPQGTGSLRERPEGSGQWSLRYDRGGSHRQVAKSFHGTREEAETRLRELIDAEHEHHGSTGGRLTS